MTSEVVWRSKAGVSVSSVKGGLCASSASRLYPQRDLDVYDSSMPGT